MIYYKLNTDWMEFPRLSINNGLARTFTLAYKLTDISSETWTERFIRFKANEEKAMYGGANLFYAAFPPLFAALGHSPDSCVFVTALSSSEAKADRARLLPFLTSELARDLSVHDGIDSLSKQPHGKIHNCRSAGERDAELAKAKYVCEKLPAKTVFVFDDFVTRGGTFSKIAQAVHQANPGSTVYGIALAKTERRSWCPNPENDQVPTKWATVWTNGESEVG